MIVVSKFDINKIILSLHEQTIVINNAWLERESRVCVALNRQYLSCKKYDSTFGTKGNALNSTPFKQKIFDIFQYEPSHIPILKINNVNLPQGMKNHILPCIYYLAFSSYN